MRLWQSILALGAWLTVPCVATAQLARLTVENDAFILRGLSDQYYTSGIRVEVLHPKLAWRPLYSLLPLAGPASQRLAGLGIGQQLYTPTNLTADTVLVGDRPYAGWLYASFSSYSANVEKRVLLTSELDLGMIGPAAAGQGFQQSLHRLEGFEKPRGWKNQLGNAPGINYYLRYERKLFELTDRLEVIVGGDLNAGTVFNNLGLTSLVRLGRYQNYFATQSMGMQGSALQASNPALPAQALLYACAACPPAFMPQAEPATNTKWEFYFYMRPLLRLVMDNSLLQGGLFTNRNPYTVPATDVTHAYLQGEYGLALGTTGFKVVANELVRTAEFRTATLHQWGSITLMARL